MKESSSDNEENNNNDNSFEYKNTIEASNGERILVFIRIRPFLEFEKKFDDNSTPITDIDLNNNSLTCKQI